MDSVAKEYRKRCRNGSGVAVAVAVGVGVLMVGGVAGGLWITQQRGGQAKPRALETRVVLPDLLRTRESLVKEATHTALHDRGVEAILADASLEICTDGSCLLSGLCVLDGVQTPYVARCKQLGGVWRVVSLRLPIVEAFGQLDAAVDQAKRQFEEAGR